MFEIVKVEAPKELSAEQVSAVKEAFRPHIEAMAELEERYKALTDVKLAEPTKEQVKEARTVRLALVKTRTGTAGTHKALKAEALVYGRYLDGMKKAQEIASTTREEKLSEIEKHYENIEKERIAGIEAERKADLTAYEVPEIAMPAELGKMEDQVWETYLAGARDAYYRKKEAEKKAEEERIAKEKAEAEERERIRVENERLKAEAAERERIEQERIAKERAERERIEAERAKERAEAEAKLKAEQEAAQAKLDAERAERERLESIERERVAAEQKAAAEKKAAEEAEAKRVADESHRKQVEADILDALVDFMVDTHAMDLIEAIKSAQIPHVTINY